MMCFARRQTEIQFSGDGQPRNAAVHYVQIDFAFLPALLVKKKAISNCILFLSRIEFHWKGKETLEWFPDRFPIDFLDIE